MNNPFDKKPELAAKLLLQSDISKKIKNKEEHKIQEEPKSGIARLKRRGIVIKDTYARDGATRADVLKTYNYVESNIPITHPYWKMSK